MEQIQIIENFEDKIQILFFLGVTFGVAAIVV